MNPFKSTPDPSWDYFSLWTNIEPAVNQLYLLAEELAQAEEATIRHDEAAIAHLEKAISILSQTLEEFKKNG